MITIIPAIDIIEGKCVRLASGDFSKKTEYNESPLDVAKRFEDAGLKRLHLVDLDGARIGKVMNFKTLETIATRTSLIIDFGGGIHSTDDVKTAFDIGAQLISTGSIVFKNRTLLLEWTTGFGAQKFIAAADVKNEKIAVAGWQQDTGITILDGIMDILSTGISQFICTDISKDGSLQGPATGLYKKILDNISPLHLIASGGVSCLRDIDEVENSGCKEVIIGKAFYEGKIKLSELNIN